MKYMFSIKRYIHMYNHLLTVSDGENKYEAIVESAPTEKKTIIVWLGDFGFPEEELEIIKTEMKQWFANQNVECIFRPGKGR